jgi:hypothetical protein
MAARSFLPALVLAVVTAVGVTHVLAGEGPRPRPFRGDAESLVTGVLPDGALVLTSVGEATHLGRFTKVELLYINGPEISGSVIFTAANGDQLFADFAGTFTSPTTAEGVYTVTGGTGRFAHATGTIDFEVSAASLSSIITLALDGSISY